MILLTEEIYGKLGEEALRARPEEACGILGGEVGPVQDLGVVKDDERIEGIRQVGGVGRTEVPLGEPDEHPSVEHDVVKQVQRLFPCGNVDDKPEWRYRIDPSDQLAAFQAIDEEDLDLIGFYHSHPRGPRRPSQTDADRATWSEVSYVIVSLDGDEPWVGSWVLEDEGGFRDERLVVTG